MSDTIFYEIKLKRTKTPMEVFEKMQRSVGKKGPAKNWVCTVDRENECMVIDFSDGESENFTLAFENRVCNDFCKVYFPLEGELFEDEKKSEFKALLNMIYSARTAFSEMKITDDYGLAESFLDSKVNKIALRELTHEENDRARGCMTTGTGSTRILSWLFCMIIGNCPMKKTTAALSTRMCPAPALI